MGVTLSLFQLRGPAALQETQVYPQHVLNFPNNWHLFEQIEGPHAEGSVPIVVHTRPIPDGMKIKLPFDDGENEDQGWVDESPVIGVGRLTYTMAVDLKRLQLREDSPYIHKAILAFISHLPDVTPIVLYWR